MQSNFDACAAFTRAAEGGLVDNPRDPAGITNMGITLATLRAWRGDQLVSPNAVRDLAWTEAKAIYGSRFWNPVQGDALPVGVDLVVFDFGVNAGPRRSAIELQETLGVVADGWIGPITLAACTAADPGGLIAKLTARHEAYYRSLSAFRMFGRGWTNRAERARTTALGMRDA